MMDTTQVLIIFSPYRNGQVSGQITFYSQGSTAIASCNGSGYGFQITTASLNFGSVGVACVDTAYAAAVNISLMDVDIDSVTFSQPMFSWAGFANIVPADDSAQIALLFTPPAPGNFSGNALIHASAGNFNVALSGLGIGWSIEPDTLGFSNILLGGSQNIPVWIVNPTLYDLTVDSIISNEDAFTCSENSITVPMMDTVEVLIIFSPYRNGQVSGQVTFYTEDSTALIECSGGGYGFQITTASLNFGSAGVFTVDTAYAVAVNVSLMNVAIDSVAFSQPMFSWAGFANLVPAGDTAQIALLFTPPASGSFSGNAAIFASAGSFNIALSGLGVGWNIEPDTLDFGICYMGHYDTLYFYCSNYEPEPLEIDSMKWTDQAYQIYPTIFTVENGQSVEVRVVLHTYTSGYHGNNLYIYTNKGNTTIRLIAWVYFSGMEEHPLAWQWNFAPVNPNPFNQKLNISFTLPAKDHIRLTVWNIQGEQVALLTEGILSPGEHNYSWDADDYSSGIYLIVLDSSRGRSIQKAVLIK